MLIEQKGVLMQKKVRERGFTLIECMLSLFILMVVVSLLLMLFKVSAFDRDIHYLFRNQAHLFFEQIEGEIHSASTIQAAGTTLLLNHSNGDVAVYELLNSNLRRRLNWTGHEVLLGDVKNVQYRLADQQLEIRVHSLQGDKLYHKILLYRSEQDV